MDSGVHASLHVSCHHQIIYAKFNLQIYYPPPYERIVWHYKHANTDHIRNAIYGFSWERSFSNKDVNEIVNIFNETISNALNNYIPHETMIYGDQDPHILITKSKERYKRKISFLAELSQILIMVLF